MTNFRANVEMTKTPEAGHNWIRGSIKYNRALKKRIGDMWTKKQEKYLLNLEEWAKEENIKI